MSALGVQAWCKVFTIQDLTESSGKQLKVINVGRFLILICKLHTYKYQKENEKDII